MESKKIIRKPFITISYELGAKGKGVIDNLAAFLQKHEARKGYNWKLYDKNLLLKVLEENQLPETVLPYLAEATESEITALIEEALGLHPPLDLLINKINHSIMGLAEGGCVVVISRGSNIITASLAQGVHVRLIGSLDKRVSYFQQYQNMGAKEAKQYILGEDKKRADYFHRNFNHNINDPLLYDLVINTDRLPVEKILDQIGSLVFDSH